MIEQEFIYIVSNQSIPNKVKVGRTTNLKQRIKQLQTTGVPTPYRYEFVALVEDSVTAEKTAHHALRFNRVASNREFFDVSLAAAIEKITRDLTYFKVYWAYTPKNAITLKVQENYTKQAKQKINSLEKKLNAIEVELNSKKKTLYALKEKLQEAKSTLLQQENLLTRVATSLINITNEKIEKRRFQLSEIQNLESLIKSKTHEISKNKIDREDLNNDLIYLRNFYKENLLEVNAELVDDGKRKIDKFFQWERISEKDFKDLSNSPIKIKSSVVIIQPGREGVLLTDENRKEIFVFADDIYNFWKY